MKLICVDGHLDLAKSLSQLLAAELVIPEHRLFPDGEHYYRLDEDFFNQDVVLLSHLHQPNDRAIGLLFLAGHLRDMGAKSIGLVAPYLAYMRQDIRFKEGECITSRYFANLINNAFDYLITIDPHLHRYHSLDEIYRIPNRALHATDIIGEYIKTMIPNALIIGPDAESAQWAEGVAAAAQCEFLVFEKTRKGDRDVSVAMPDLSGYADVQPVLVDDIMSTGRTLVETAEGLVEAGLRPAICIGVHPVLATGAETTLNNPAIANWLSCNTIPHASNAIDVSHLLAPAITAMVVEIIL
jgi:ribose-phosphate pyrophosphokinase